MSLFGLFIGKFQFGENAKSLSEKLILQEELVERLFRALDFITSIRVDESLEKDHNHRLEITKNDLNSFLSQWPESKIYLSDEINSKLSDLWLLWNKINTNIEMHLSLPEYKDDTFYNENFGPKGKETRKKLEDELKKSILEVIHNA